MNPKPPTNGRKRRKKQDRDDAQTKNRQPMKEKGGKVGKHINDLASRPGKTQNPKEKWENLKSYCFKKDVRVNCITALSWALRCIETPAFANVSKHLRLCFEAKATH